MPEKTEAQKKAQQKYMEKVAVARVRMDRAKYDAVQAHAEAHSESVNGFINRAIEETMERDTDPPEVFFANAVDTIADHCNISKWDVIAAVEQAKATNKEG